MRLEGETKICAAKGNKGTKICAWEGDFSSEEIHSGRRSVRFGDFSFIFWENFGLEKNLCLLS